MSNFCYKKKTWISVVLCLIMVICLLNGCAPFSKGNGNTNNSPIPSPDDGKENSDFNKFLEDLFCQEVTSNTINLHYTLENPAAYGIEDYEVTFGDISDEARETSKKELNTTKKELDSFSHHELNGRQQLCFDLLSDYLDAQIALADYELYEEILTPSNGIQSQLPVLLAEYKFNCKQDVEDYLSLISQIDTYYSQIMDFEEEKADKGYFMSDALCMKVIDGCESFIQNPSENYLLHTFDDKVRSVDGLTEEEIASYIEKNRSIILKEVIPAYQTMISRLTALLGSGQNDWGICNIKDGAKYYELLVQSELGCKDSIEEIDSAINEMRIYDLTRCAEIQDENPDIWDMLDAMEWDMTDETEMLDLLQTAMLSDFPAPVDTSYTISYVDESLQDSLAPAFYITAPIDNYSENAIYVNPADKQTDIYYFTTLAHEGFPGHLYQTTMSYSYGLEAFRSILNYSGYIEGWATYVEMMSYFYAGLDQDIASMLQHNQSAMLSLYASSDIGIHYYGWEEDDMYQFWSSYGITDRAAINEITGLILSEPGNYLKYYVGYLQFVKLREQIQTSYGDDFSLTEFHKALLQIGPAPFYIIEKYFDTYYCIPQTSSTSS